jgi:hypothetical protein
MSKQEVKWLKGILSALILFMIEASTNINQELFNAISFVFEEPNLKILKPLFVAVFLALEWIGLYQTLEKVIK